MKAQAEPLMPGVGAKRQSRSPYNAVVHGLLSRFRLADDIEGVAAEIGADLLAQLDPPSEEMKRAVTDLALAEMRLFRVRERQRATDRLIADFVARGDFLQSGTARALAAHLGLSSAGPNTAMLDALGATAPRLAEILTDPVAEVLRQRRVLRRYAVEANRRRRTALGRVLSFCTTACEAPGSDET